MMNLERHIEILLLDNDCVIVPDLGAFIAHHLSARYVEAENIFFPPHRTLGFNPQLRVNDSLLAQSYIEAYDISYPEAMRRIAAEVQELKLQLTHDGEYLLNNLGVLRINEQGQYHFTPCEAGILTPELYALNSLEMDKLGQSSEVVDDESVAETVPLNRQEGGIFIKYSTIRSVAAACIAVLAILLYPSQFKSDSQQTVANTHFNTALLQRVMPKDITVGHPDLTQSRIDEPQATTEQAEIVVETEEAEVEKPSVPASSGYVIVLASQVGQKNAEYFVDQMQKKGFDTTRMLSTGTTLRVVYGTYPSEAEAYEALKPLRGQSPEFAEAWVLKL